MYDKWGLRNENLKVEEKRQKTTPIWAVPWCRMYGPDTFAGLWTKINLKPNTTIKEI